MLLPALGENAGRVSVRGAKITPDNEAAAFVLFQTPPPVVPNQTVLPEGSFGSIAMEVIRPVTGPYRVDITVAGPRGVHAEDRLVTAAALGTSSAAGLAERARRVGCRRLVADCASAAGAVFRPARNRLA